MSKPKFDYKKANERKREIGNRLNELAEKLESKEQLTEQQREAINTEARELKTELEATNMRIAAALAVTLSSANCSRTSARVSVRSVKLPWVSLTTVTRTT